MSPRNAYGLPCLPPLSPEDLTSVLSPPARILGCRILHTTPSDQDRVPTKRPRLARLPPYLQASTAAFAARLPVLTRTSHMSNWGSWLHALLAPHLWDPSSGPWPHLAHDAFVGREHEHPISPYPLDNDVVHNLARLVMVSAYTTATGRHTASDVPPAEKTAVTSTAGEHAKSPRPRNSLKLAHLLDLALALHAFAVSTSTSAAAIHAVHLQIATLHTLLPSLHASSVDKSIAYKTCIDTITALVERMTAACIADVHVDMAAARPFRGIEGKSPVIVRAVVDFCDGLAPIAVSRRQCHGHSVCDSAELAEEDVDAWVSYVFQGRHERRWADLCNAVNRIIVYGLCGDAERIGYIDDLFVEVSRSIVAFHIHASITHTASRAADEERFFWESAREGMTPRIAQVVDEQAQLSTGCLTLLARLRAAFSMFHFKAFLIDSQQFVDGKVERPVSPYVSYGYEEDTITGVVSIFKDNIVRCFLASNCFESAVRDVAHVITLLKSRGNEEAASKWCAVSAKALIAEAGPWLPPSPPSTTMANQASRAVMAVFHAAWIMSKRSIVANASSASLSQDVISSMPQINLIGRAGRYDVLQSSLVADALFHACRVSDWDRRGAIALVDSVVGLDAAKIASFENGQRGYPIRWERQARVVHFVGRLTASHGWTPRQIRSLIAMMWDVFRGCPKADVTMCDKRALQQVNKWRDEGNPQALQLQAMLESGFGSFRSLWEKHGCAINPERSIHLLIQALKEGTTGPAAILRSTLRAQPRGSGDQVAKAHTYISSRVVCAAMSAMNDCSTTDADAAYHTANVYFFGCHGVTRDLDKSFRLYDAALSLGNCSRWTKSAAAYNLGLMCERGEGCGKRSHKRAAGYYSQALKIGNGRNAFKNLADLFQRGHDPNREGFDLPVNIDKARTHYRAWFSYKKPEYLTFITLERREYQVKFVSAELREDEHDLDDRKVRVVTSSPDDDYVYEWVATGIWNMTAIDVDIDKEDAFVAAVGTDAIFELRNFGQIVSSQPIA
jgi:Sel1 repeat